MKRLGFTLAALAMGIALQSAAVAQSSSNGDKQKDSNQNRSQQQQKKQEQKRSQKSQQDRQRQQSKKARTEGRVVRSKKVGVRGTNEEHLVVMLKTNRGRLAVVDLGPVKRLADVKIATGDTLYVAGNVVAIGDRQALMADEVGKEGRKHRIDRRKRQGSRGERQGREQNLQARRGQREQQGQKSDGRRVHRGHVSGTIAKTKKVDIKGTDKQHVIALLETESGKKVPVNLGPSEGLKNANLKSGKNISVYGVLLKVGDKNTIIAEQVAVDDRKFKINRQNERSVRGQIQAIKDLRLPRMQTTARIARVETQNDKTMFVVLGAKSRIQPLDLQEGDNIEVTGRVIPMADRRVFIANTVTADGETIRTMKRRGEEGRRQQSRGEERQSRPRRQRDRADGQPTQADGGSGGQYR